MENAGPCLASYRRSSAARSSSTHSRIVMPRSTARSLIFRCMASGMFTTRRASFASSAAAPTGFHLADTKRSAATSLVGARVGGFPLLENWTSPQPSCNAFQCVLTVRPGEPSSHRPDVRERDRLPATRLGERETNEKDDFRSSGRDQSSGRSLRTRSLLVGTRNLRADVLFRDARVERQPLLLCRGDPHVLLARRRRSVGRIAWARGGSRGRASEKVKALV